ncbi:MAG: DNA polymerase III subunit delta', partial [Deltaproteobacteria bacterium]|nr:DNA polymerase III subunit delta' [Deltaproteobacteria bacterium]
MPGGGKGAGSSAPREKLVAGFADIQGQDAAVAKLRRALREGRVPHAYLFCGPIGVGKERTALVLAQALQCRKLPDDGCGRCEPCRKVAGARHPDVAVVRVPEGRSRVLIEQMRELQQCLAFRPYEGRNRVIVFPDAEVMTEEAANSLLKTLEEPPEQTHFVLTSSQPQNLLDTIRSRCQQVRFAPLSRAEVGRRLIMEQVDEQLAFTAAGLS